LHRFPNHNFTVFRTIFGLFISPSPKVYGCRFVWHSFDRSQYMLILKSHSCCEFVGEVDLSWIPWKVKIKPLSQFGVFLLIGQTLQWWDQDSSTHAFKKLICWIFWIDFTFFSCQFWIQCIPAHHFFRHKDTFVQPNIAIDY